MKKILAKAGIGVLAAGLLISATSMVYAADEADLRAESAVVSEFELENDIEVAFWKKKDKVAEPKEENPNAAPSQQKGAPRENKQETQKPAQNPGHTPAPAPAPSPAPQTNPVPHSPRDKAHPHHEDKPETKPEHDKNNKNTPSETSDASFVRNSRPARQSQQQGVQPSGQPGQQPGNQQNLQPNQINQPIQQNQQNQPMPQNQQNMHQRDGQYNQQQNRHLCTDYAPGIVCEINKILANQPALKLDPNAYMVQHDDGLWLVMGNIRAKVDILIYVDQKHMPVGEFDGGNAIPLYK